MIAGSTKLINQIPKLATCIPNILFENNPKIKTLAAALTGSSVNPIVGNNTIIR